MPLGELEGKLVERRRKLVRIRTAILKEGRLDGGGEVDRLLEEFRKALGDLIYEFEREEGRV